MKKLLLLLLCILVTASVWADIHEKLDIERSLNEQITSELSPLLQAGSFSVFASVRLRKVRVREIVGGERYESKKKDLGSDLPSMPGFNKEILSDLDDDIKKEKQTYRVREKTEIRSVTAKIMIDKSVPDEKVKIARAAITQRLRSSFGKKARVSIARANLLNQNTGGSKEEYSEAFSRVRSFFLENLGPMIFLIVSLGLLLLWASKRKRSQFDVPYRYVDNNIPPWKDASGGEAFPPFEDNRPKNSNLLDFSNDDEVPPEFIEPLNRNNKQFEELVEILVEKISNDPLVVRSFLEKLKDEEKQRLISCFETSSLKKVIKDMLGFDGESTNASKALSPSNSGAAFLKNLTSELSQYSRLVGVKIGQKLGKVALLNDIELTRLTDGIGDKEICHLLKFLPRPIVSKLLKSMPKDRVKRIFSNLEQGASLVGEETLEVERVIDGEVDKLSNEIFLTYNRNNDLSRMIIEESQNDKAFLKELVSENEGAIGKYQEYMIDISDLMAKYPKILNECFNELENESLVIVLKGLSDTELDYAYKLIPSDRANVVKSLFVSTNGSYEEDEINVALSDLLSLARKKIRRGKSSQRNVA